MQLVSKLNNADSEPNTHIEEIPLRPCWQQLIEGLPELGPVKLQAENEHVSFSFLCEPWQVRFNGNDSAIVFGNDVQIAISLSKLHKATAKRNNDIWQQGHCVCISSCKHKALCRIIPGDSSDWFSYYNLVTGLLALDQQSSTPVLSTVGTDNKTLLNHARRYGFNELANHISDIAESLADAHENSKAQAIDISLLGPFLETLCDQNHAIKITLANQAGVFSNTQSFYGLQHKGSTLRLKNSANQLHIDLSNIFTVWVINKVSQFSQIRLCNANGEVVLILEDASEHGYSPNGLWATLIRALTD